MHQCSSSTKLVSMMVLTTSYMIVELVVGNLTNSMALVADSFHMLSDVIALVIAFISVRRDLNIVHLDHDHHVPGYPSRSVTATHSAGPGPRWWVLWSTRCFSSLSASPSLSRLSRGEL